MRSLVATAIVALGLTTIAAAQNTDTSKLTERIDAAHVVLHELIQTPDKGVPLDIAAKARCVAVIPSMKKGAFLVGAQYGQGVATCRTANGWSAPAFIQLTGASFGFQAGGEATDLVLIGMNDKSMDDLLKDKVKLGGDASVAAGPVGRSAQASTTELMNAEFLTYSRSKGIFAGIDLNGDVVHQNTDDTKAYYGQNIQYRAILAGDVPTPASARHFVATVNEMFRMGEARKS
jgi:lipid-binding SYLF domain-containing protein